MEKRIFIRQVLPLVERPYTDRNGQPQTFASRGILFTTGIDEVYGEVTGDLARALPDTFDLNKIYFIQAQMKARPFTDKNGVQRYDNTLVITKIM